MKKLFLSLVAMATTVCAFALTPTATARLTMTNTANAGESDYVLLVESLVDGFTNSYDNGSDSRQPAANVPGIYSICGSELLAIDMTDDLEQKALGVITGAGTEYKITFSSVSGRELKLYDLYTGDITVVASSNEYVFTAPANTRIANRFVINYDALQVTTNAYGFCTFAADVNATLPAGLKAYKGAVSAEGDELALAEVADIPANAGVVLYGAANTTYSLTEAVSASADMSGNDLVGCAARTAVSGDNIFVLSGNTFLQYTGANIPAGKAYLLLPGGAPAPGHRLRIRIEAPTAVEAVAAEAKAEKLVRDGRLLILRDGKTYNVQGQLVK